MGGSYEDTRILRTLAGAEAVRRLSVRQHDAFARGDAAGWVGTFVVDGELALPDAEPRRGHAALLEWVRSMDGPRPTVLSTDSVVEIDGVRGTQRSTLVVLAPEGGAPSGGGRPRLTLAALLQAEDELVHERGRWYFARRRVGPVGAP